MTLPKFVLASASPARLKLLQAIGIAPEVIVSAVDEEALSSKSGWSTPHDISQGLAIAKAQVVAEQVSAPALIIGCDSVMEFEGIAYGKPANEAEAKERLRAMSGSFGSLYTGHHLILLTDSGRREASALVRTEVHFHEITDAEIDAYIATGEPLRVAGSYTLDALGGPFLREIHGDSTNVVGLSVPTLRLLLREVGIGWEQVLEGAVPNAQPRPNTGG